MKGYIIDCDYVIRVRDYMRIRRIPIILVDSGEYARESEDRT